MPRPAATAALAKLEAFGFSPDRRTPLVKGIPGQFQAPVSSRENTESLDIRGYLEAFQSQIEQKLRDVKEVMLAFEQKQMQLEGRIESTEMLTCGKPLQALTSSVMPAMSPNKSPAMSPAMSPSFTQSTLESPRFAQDTDDRMQALEQKSTQIETRLVAMVNDHWSMVGNSLREQIQFIQSTLDSKTSNLATLEKTVLADREVWQSRLRALEMGGGVAGSKQLMPMATPGPTASGQKEQAPAWMEQMSNLAKTLEKTVVDKIMPRVAEGGDGDASTITPATTPGARPSGSSNNGDSGAEIEEKMKGAKATKVILKREGDNWQHVGLTLSPQYKQGILEVEEVWDPSLISEWNKNNPQYKVCRGDIIKTVNGISGQAENMIVEVARATEGDVVELVVCRLGDSKAPPMSRTASS